MGDTGQGKGAKTSGTGAAVEGRAQSPTAPARSFADVYNDPRADMDHLTRAADRDPAAAMAFLEAKHGSLDSVVERLTPVRDEARKLDKAYRQAIDRSGSQMARWDDAYKARALKAQDSLEKREKALQKKHDKLLSAGDDFTALEWIDQRAARASSMAHEIRNGRS
jgi:hypothetical protein